MRKTQNEEMQAFLRACDKNDVAVSTTPRTRNVARVVVVDNGRDGKSYRFVEENGLSIPKQKVLRQKKNGRSGRKNRYGRGDMVNATRRSNRHT